MCVSFSSFLLLFLSPSSDCADKVVNGNGKFEALIVNSKDIAACTAQLVKSRHFWISTSNLTSSLS